VCTNARDFGWLWRGGQLLRARSAGKTPANASSPRLLVTYPFDLLVKLNFRHGWLLAGASQRDFGWLWRGGQRCLAANAG